MLIPWDKRLAHRAFQPWWRLLSMLIICQLASAAEGINSGASREEKLRSYLTDSVSNKRYAEASDGYDLAYSSLEDLQGQMSALKSERSELREKYTAKHPAILGITKQIDELADYIKQRNLLLAEQLRTSSSMSYPTILDHQSEPYLPDYSYAGYHWGERPIPVLEGREFNVVDFGAVANDGIDDTKAIQLALQRAQENAGLSIVTFPPGQFVLQEILHIERARIIIRGSGDDQTTIYIPNTVLNAANQGTFFVDQLRRNEKRSLEEGTKLISPASWSGGFIWTGSTKNNTKPLAVALSGKRGGFQLQLDPSHKLNAGDVVEVRWCTSGCDVEGFLSHALDYQNVEIGKKTRSVGPAGVTKQYVEIDQVLGDSIVLKEPLLHNINPEWRVNLSATQFIENVGLENLEIKFPETSYAGHHAESGYNGVYLKGLAHSWVRDVTVTNADNAFLVTGCKNISLINVATRGRGGHHSVSVSNSSNVLVDKFDLKAISIHGPSAGTYANKTVFTHGVVNRMSIDQHSGMNQQNLFDTIKIYLSDLGDLFNHGGSADRMPTAGAFSTFWNIYVKAQMNSPLILRNAPSGRLINLYGNHTIELLYGPNAWVEGLNFPPRKVDSLYQYQLDQRLIK